MSVCPVGYLVLWVGVRSLTRAVQPEEIVTVFIPAVRLLFVLRETATHDHTRITSDTLHQQQALTGNSLHSVSPNFSFPQSHRKFLWRGKNIWGERVCVREREIRPLRVILTSWCRAQTVHGLHDTCMNRRDRFLLVLLPSVCRCYTRTELDASHTPRTP